MSTTIFTLENVDDYSEKINIDELYERKRQGDLSQLTLYKKILSRIHLRIRTISRQKSNVNEFFCWYVVPEVILGVSKLKYDQGACIAYIICQLKENGFNVRYIHPNTLFISWLHWVPSYVRAEIKNKTGIIINEFGERKPDDPSEKDEMEEYHNTNTNNQGKEETGARKKQYTPIETYKPLGNLIYEEDFFNKMEKRIH
jgi:hypothetical protein